MPALPQLRSFSPHSSYDEGCQEMNQSVELRRGRRGGKARRRQGVFEGALTPPHDDRALNAVGSIERKVAVHVINVAVRVAVVEVEALGDPLGLISWHLRAVHTTFCILSIIAPLDCENRKFLGTCVRCTQSLASHPSSQP